MRRRHHCFIQYECRSQLPMSCLTSIILRRLCVAGQKRNRAAVFISAPTLIQTDNKFSFAMNKMFFVIWLLLFFSCRKNNEPETLPLTLLADFNWRSIRLHMELFVLDTTQKISCSDTALYSFAGSSFLRKERNIVVQQIFGSGTPRYQLQKINTMIEAQYQVNPPDSTLLIT